MEIMRLLLIGFTLLGISHSLGIQAKEVQSGNLKRGFFYKGGRKSIFEFENLDLQKWLDLKTWKVERALKDQNPEWRRKFQAQNFKENFGRVISCYKKCRVYRGRKYLYGQTYTRIKEGDSIETEDDSYAWIYLYDGSLIRVSPNTSIAFQEINISNNEFFVYLRINEGNLVVLSRDQNLLPENNKRQTDSLFLKDAEKILDFEDNKEERMTSQEVFQQMIGQNDTTLRLNKRVNTEIEKNNESLGQKDTKFFIVFPNGSLLSNNLNAEFFVNLGGKSYFELREARNRNSDALFFYRGYRKKESSILSDATVYEVSEDGRDLISKDKEFFKFSKSLVASIPSILLIRELWIRKYSKYLFSTDLDRFTLATQHGYRLWSGFEKGGELQKRLSWLAPYVRVRETGYLNTLRKYFRQRKIGVEEFSTLPNKFFQLSLDNYARSLDRRKLKR